MKKEEQMEQISSNPEQQKNYEFFERGYDNGELDERERIIQIIREMQPEFEPVNDFVGILLHKIGEMKN